MKRLTMSIVAVLLLLAMALPAAAQGEQDIVEIAAGNPDFSTLVGAVQQAGLVETLQGEGPFTVFAPTNAAFAALPAGTLESLDEATLRSILTYHVVSGNVMAADVMGMDGQSVATVQGESITISVQGNTVRVNNATVVTTDIEASNGVIHVIDTVLLPPTVQQAMQAGAAAPAPQALPQTGGSSTPVLPAAALAAGLFLLLGGGALLRLQAGRAR
jgi:LPXTG-motif cell wall-anchored protein